MDMMPIVDKYRGQEGQPPMSPSAAPARYLNDTNRVWDSCDCPTDYFLFAVKYVSASRNSICELSPGDLPRV